MHDLLVHGSQLVGVLHLQSVDMAQVVPVPDAPLSLRDAPLALLVLVLVIVPEYHIFEVPKSATTVR